MDTGDRDIAAHEGTLGPEEHGEAEAGAVQDAVQPQSTAGVVQGGATDGDPAPTEEAGGQELGDAPTRRIEVGFVAGDFAVVGGASQVTLNVPGGYDEGALAERDGVLRFADLPHRSELRVPDGAEVRVRRVDGDLRAGRLDAMLVVQSIGGDADLERVAVADLHAVDGDLTAEHGGSLRALSVGGDARLVDFDDRCILGRVGGDVRAVGLPGLAVRDAVGGAITVDSCREVTLLGSVGGDLHVEHGVTSVRAQAVRGDVRISSVGDAVLSAVGGDFRVDGSSGPVEVSAIGGDAHIRSARGAVRLGRLGGDLTAQGASGGLLAGHVGGDATLDTPLGPGAECAVYAAGDITLRVRGEVNARFVAQSFGGEVRTQLPLTVEKGRRRNLVGVLGNGSATVTLRSDGGDIFITAAEKIEGRDSMDDQDQTRTTEDEKGDAAGTRTWEGSFGGHRFRVRVDRGPDRAGVHFQGPLPEGEDQSAAGPGSRDFGFEWERGRGARTYGEYEERLREFGDKAEKAARKAAEQAQRYAEKAAQRARETDWEAVGREVRSAIEKAMGELEDAFTQVRGEWESRRAGGNGGSARPGAQRVRIEHEDEAAAPGYSAGASAATAAAAGTDRETQRRDILEQLRLGSITIEDAERRLNDLR